MDNDLRAELNDVTGDLPEPNSAGVGSDLTKKHMSKLKRKLLSDDFRKSFKSTISDKEEQSPALSKNGRNYGKDDRSY